MDNGGKINLKSKCNKKLLPYILRFSLIFSLVYIAVAFLFSLFRDALPETERIALDLYEPFYFLNLTVFTGQLLRGVAFSLVLYPFYDFCFRNRHSLVILLISMFGLGLIGSVEPQPGSIEGMLYTLISLREHFYVIVAVALHITLFSLIFLYIERVLYNEGEPGKKTELFPRMLRLKGYFAKFVLLHLLTYWIVGSIFYEISGYQEALESMEIFKLWRPMESFQTVLIIFSGQVFRGLFLALLLYPFYRFYIHKKHGWLLLYLLLAGLTILGSPIFLTEFISLEGSFNEFLKGLLVGIPEIFSQMLVFSLLFFYWQKRVEKKK